MILHRLETFLHIVAITNLGGKGGETFKLNNLLVITRALHRSVRLKGLV